MPKKCGLRMAQGGLVQGDERAALYAKYGIKPGGGAPAAQPTPQPVAQPTTPTQKPQAGGLLNQATSALSGRRRQLEAAMNYAEGGIVRGKGGPTADEVPMQVAGKNVNLSNTEAVLPAKTVQALGGPKAVEALIEQTNGKPPVKGGLREGGHYDLGAVTPYSEELGQGVKSAFKNTAKAWSENNAAIGKAAAEGAPGSVLGQSLRSPFTLAAGFAKDVGNSVKYALDPAANMLKTAVTGDVTPASPTAPTASNPASAGAATPATSQTLSDAVGINVKGMSPEQRTLAADAYGNYVDQQTGTTGINNGNGPINYGGMQRRIDAYGKEPGLLAARNAREDLLGSGIRMGVDGKGGLTIDNTGDRSNGTLAAAGGTTMDMKGANEIYARANAIRGSMINSMANANGPSGAGLAILGGGSRMSDERAALLKKAMTAHPGAQNGQLTLGQMNAARGLMGDAQSEQLKARELALNAQRVAAEGSTKQQELGLRAQEAASLDAYRKGSLTNDAQKTAATAKAAAQANYLALSKDQREVMDGYVKKMIPTDGLKDDDLKAAQKGQAEMTEAIMKAAGGILPLDPQELQSVLPQLIDQGRLTLNERDAALNPSLRDRLNNLMGANVDREGSMYAKNTVTLSNGNIVQVGKNGKVVGPELDPRKVYGRNADLRQAAEQRREQFAAQQ